jgi:branched-chain amino acid aminotransferase
VLTRSQAQNAGACDDNLLAKQADSWQITLMITTTYAWMDGRVFLATQTALSLLDHGVLVGDGVFESLLVTAGKPFAFRRHIERLRRSAEGLGLTLSVSDAKLRAAVDDLITTAGASKGRLRITLTSGQGPSGSARGALSPRLFLLLSQEPHWEPSANVVTVPWVRNERSAVVGLKTTSYAENVVALEYAKKRGADEAIFANTQGHLCEGTGTNVFVVIGGVLCTPPLASGCLNGVTRQLVCETSKVDEREMPLSALASAQEAFLTSSTRKIQPIAHVNGQPMPAEIGPVTQAAMAAFEAMATDDP